MKRATTPSGPKPAALSPGRGRIDGLKAVAGLFGHELYPWQAKVGAMGLARRDGRWRRAVNVVVVPRQSGKTRLVFMLSIDRCLHRPGSEVWYTAQSRNDAALRFRELVRLLRRSSLAESKHRYGYDAEWDYRVRLGMGTEEIEFANGSFLRIFAPSEDSLHGSVTDLVVLDEARFYDQWRGDALMAAALPTQATRDGQVWITSTAGGPESQFLERQVEMARGQGDGGHIGLAEWRIPEDVTPGELLEVVWACHPAAGMPGGPRREALAVAADQMPAWQFAHEYGNRWRTEADVRVLPASAWAACMHEAPLAPGRPVFAADVPLDRSASPIVACVDGVVELVDCVPAVGVAHRLAELAAAWDPWAIVVDAAGPAGTVAEQLRPMSDRLVVSSTRDLTAACLAFYDAVIAGTARIRPSLVLTSAATVAARRNVGQAWVWSRVDGGAPLVAASLALWQWHRIAAEAVTEAPAIF